MILSLVLVIGAMANVSTVAHAVETESEQDRLAQEVDDPTAILTQLKFQDLYTPQSYKTTAQTNELQLKIVVPVDAFPIVPFKQIIRPSFSLKTLPVSEGSSTITEFSDMELLDLFISNWPDPKTTGFGWAVGPTFVFPTGRVLAAGNHSWQAGPAAAAIYRGVPHLMVGFLLQNPISFAYTNSSASPRSQMKFQPLISYTLGRGWYLKSADSTWTVSWRHNSSTTLPISLGVGKVWAADGPELNTWISGEWTAYRQYTGVTPKCTVRFGLTLLFPNVQF